MNGENGEMEDNILIDALMKWTAPVQRDYLKLMHKPTSGTKEALVNRIIGCLPIEKAVEIIKEHRGYLKLVWDIISDAAAFFALLILCIPRGE